MSIVAIGWDVRGWRGTQQAVAVLKLDENTRESKWWISDDFQFRSDQTFNLNLLLEKVTGGEDCPLLADEDAIVVGIDAPLAFPSSFIELLTNEKMVVAPSESEIHNPLAYRDCERWIHEHYGKKPLSATFDKIGNAATLAISMAHALMQEGFELVPQSAKHAKRAIIEVYPAIHKIQPRRMAAAIEPVHRLIPNNIAVGSDQYDAAICAITAAVFAGAGNILSLPGTINFQHGFSINEGWIYGLPADYINRHR